MKQSEDVCQRWKSGKLRQKDAAGLPVPGISKRTFRRYIVRYSNKGKDGLADKRIGRILSPNSPPAPHASRSLHRHLSSLSSSAHQNGLLTDR